MGLAAALQANALRCWCSQLGCLKAVAQHGLALAV
ncbi:MAG: hypothetical protein EOO62_38815 [Hymenobacter sp.]|nr:MAG: hypothetical protein EOO62_38815 [Hymenobacter sp.]